MIKPKSYDPIGSHDVSTPTAKLLLWLSLAAICNLGAAAVPQAQDLGPSNSGAAATASLVLRVHHPGILEAYVASTQDPVSPSYHRFLSLSDFVSFFAPSSGEIAILTQYLNSFGIQVTEVYGDRLLVKAAGTVGAFNNAFSMNVHDFLSNGERFQRPLRKANIPSVLRDILAVVVIQSGQGQFRPKNVRLDDRLKAPLRQLAPAPNTPPTATGIPQQYTVVDFANRYDVNPLYQANIDGKGQTIGIITLADFLPTDAYAYWNYINLPVLANRITTVDVDGGAPLGSAAGSGETSLDVEQSGGLAPQAKIIVYEAPNNNAGFIDLFYKAASDNLVDSLSTSWGQTEDFFFQALAGEDDTGQMLAFHQAFLELAAQGISSFAAAGDNGAYDIFQGDSSNPPRLTVTHSLSITPLPIRR